MLLAVNVTYISWRRWITHAGEVSLRWDVLWSKGLGFVKLNLPINKQGKQSLDCSNRDAAGRSLWDSDPEHQRLPAFPRKTTFLRLLQLTRWTKADTERWNDETSYSIVSVCAERSSANAILSVCKLWMRAALACRPVMFSMVPGIRDNYTLVISLPFFTRGFC